MLPVMCLETCVFMGSYVRREGGRPVCYWHHVLLALSCVKCVCERVATVYSSFNGCMGRGTERSVLSESELLHRVIEAQCGYRWLNDM